MSKIKLPRKIQKKSDAFFSGDMKLADLLFSNYPLLMLLPRFGINLGFGEMSISEVCKKYRINDSFFLLVCNVYANQEYLPGNKDVADLDIDDLITYLQNSHRYYIDEKLIAIEDKLGAMKCSCEEKHYQIIRTFFDGYKKELINHFDYEEDIVFPYIRRLMQGVAGMDFHISQFEENHSNIEDKLNDLKNIIIKYLPDTCSFKERSQVLFEIFLFEEDLNRHTLIEEKILVPFVLKTEKRYEQQA